MLIDAVMTKDVLTLDVGETLESAVELMIRYRTGSVVVTKNGVPQALVTETDAVRAEYFAERPFDRISVGRAMSRPLHTINRWLPVENALRKMGSEGVSKLGVTDGPDLVGVVTTTDVAHSYLARPRDTYAKTGSRSKRAPLA